MAEITKMWIADTIREIMKYKPIDKIRVTEICKAADIDILTPKYPRIGILLSIRFGGIVLIVICFTLLDQMIPSRQ